MAQAEKATYYRALKDHDVTFDKHYRDYTTEELKGAWGVFAEAHGLDPVLTTDAVAPSSPTLPEPRGPEQPAGDAGLREDLARLTATVGQLAQIIVAQQVPAPAPAAAPAPDTRPAGLREPARPAPQLDPNQHAGVTQNTHADDQVLETDEFGNQWYQKEVTKPAFPKPRGRRVLRYDDPGTQIEEIKVGEYIETFEVAGDARNSRPSEVKITLPSYQTGIYRAPNMPFRIHTYAGVRGFSLADVHEYYGGRDLVPDTIKRMYVSTDLCYDIQTTIRTIEDEYRERVLGNRK